MKPRIKGRAETADAFKRGISRYLDDPIYRPTKQTLRRDKHACYTARWRGYSTAKPSPLERLQHPWDGWRHR